MLFNSYVFIFLFLPMSLLVFFQLGKRGYYRAAIGSVVLFSFFFYGWWDPRYLWLIAGSMIFNYAAGVRLSLGAKSFKAKTVLTLSVAVNLALLGYYKYANFFVENLNTLSGTSFHLQQIILPLGISFFTFTQIAYLVDAYRGETKEYNLLDYGLFVVFFPHLIAGPIIHHKDIIPQFEDKKIFQPDWSHLSTGISIFVIGLYKKVVLADTMAVFASPIFIAANRGDALHFYGSWGGALAYTLQIYFDFSGYSDMAIGLARMFGVLFPINFHSPYKAVNIVEFWRRWHMTLSRFLRDYLYISLGGNRSGNLRRYFNIFITMLLGGIWHGAGWTFVVWGALHGIYLIGNHAWHHSRRMLGQDPNQSTKFGRAVSILLTFIFVVIGWIFFRAETFHSAILILKGMIHLQEIAFTMTEVKTAYHQILWTWGLLAVVWFLPNTQQIMARFQPALDFPAKGKSLPMPNRIAWQPNFIWALFISFAFLVAVMHLSQITEFLYFQF